MHTSWCRVVALVTLFVPISARCQQSSVRDCEAVLLAKDIYKYASSSNLQEDYLNSVDKDTWEEMRTSNSAGLSYAGIGASDDFNSMDAKRTHYFEQTNFHRSRAESLSTLQIVTSERAYKAYSDCLRSLPDRSGLIVWVAKENATQLKLVVKYSNPAGVSKMGIRSYIQGGKVQYPRVPAHQIWRGTRVWGVNQEFTFDIERDHGKASTDIRIEPVDGSTALARPMRVQMQR